MEQIRAVVGFLNGGSIVPLKLDPSFEIGIGRMNSEEGLWSPFWDVIKATWKFFKYLQQDSTACSSFHFEQDYGALIKVILRLVLSAPFSR